MRKIFIKCSDERSRKYSIITTIAKTDDGMKVFKEACFAEGREHLQRVSGYAEILESVYAPVRACPVIYDGEKLIFDYLEGESLEMKIRNAVRAGDAEGVLGLFMKQKSILMSSRENETEFVPSEEFEEWFGDARPYAGSAGFKVSNFDGIPGNIIFQGEDIYFIDYEWVMTFVMPRDLVLYHCVRDAYYHIEGLGELVPLPGLMSALGVRTDLNALQRSYEHFFDYVISESDGTGFATIKRMTLKAHTGLDEFWDTDVHGIKAALRKNTAYDMWRECDKTVAVLQGRIGKLEEELAAQKKKYAELDDAWFSRWDEVRARANLEKDQADDKYAHEMESYRAMEADRDIWKHMYEDVTGSRSFKAVQSVKKILRKKG